MIEIVKGKGLEEFELIAENEIIHETYITKLKNGFYIVITGQPKLRTNFEKLIGRLEECDIGSFVYYKKKPIPFLISVFGTNYDWEQLSFSHSFHIKNIGNNQIIYFEFGCSEDDSYYWTYKYSPNHVYNQLTLISHERINIILGYEEDFAFKIELKKEFTTTLLASYNELIKAIYEIEQELYKRIESFTWKEDYHTDEPKFTKEVMIPLLKKMKYKNVRYNHGTDEYGRDVIFSEINKFNEEIFYGIQVKAGDVSGGANSQIDTLIAQLDDAFRMPFKLLGDENKRYLSFFIIAISGHYKKNAKAKILEKVPQAYKQHVFFWDKDSIEALTGTYWKAD